MFFIWLIFTSIYSLFSFSFSLHCTMVAHQYQLNFMLLFHCFVYIFMFESLSHANSFWKILLFSDIKKNWFCFDLKINFHFEFQYNLIFFSEMTLFYFKKKTFYSVFTLILNSFKNHFPFCFWIFFNFNNYFWKEMFYMAQQYQLKKVFCF